MLLFSTLLIIQSITVWWGRGMHKHAAALVTVLEVVFLDHAAVLVDVQEMLTFGGSVRCLCVACHIQIVMSH